MTEGWELIESVTEYETGWYEGGYDLMEQPDGTRKRYYWAELPPAVVIVAVADDQPGGLLALRAGVLGDEDGAGRGKPARDGNHQEHEGEREAQGPDGLGREPPQIQGVGDVVRHLQQLDDDDRPGQVEQRPDQTPFGDRLPGVAAVIVVTTSIAEVVGWFRRIVIAVGGLVAHWLCRRTGG